MKVLITAPSLTESDNVSGISALVRGIIESSPEADFKHFLLGKKDKQKKGFSWLLNQLMVIPRAILILIQSSPDLVHLNTGLEKASIIRDYSVFWIAKRIFGKRIIFHIHGGYYLMQPPPQGSMLYKMLKDMLYNSAAVIVLSVLESKQIEADYQFTKCIVLPNAVKVPARVPDRSVVKNKLGICFLGRIVKSKGVYVIAEALKSLEGNYDKFDFNIYGAGPEKDGLEAQLAALKQLNYSFKGVVGGEAKWQALAQNEVFLLPSIFGEGLPVALLEAMAMSCIVVVTNDASITAVVKDGTNGILVPKNDAETLASKLTYIIDNYQALQGMATSATQTIANYYSIEKYSQELMKIYRNG